MAKININISSPNDGLGDALRTAFSHTNDMFTELYANVVMKEAGKGLSSNDFTSTDKIKLTGIASGAEVNVQADMLQEDTLQDSFVQNRLAILPSNEVLSVFARVGVVVAQTNDYNADQILETATKVFVTPSEKTAITHTNRASLDLVSGTNTGDQNLSGYELLANKQNSLSVDGTGTKYPTVDAVNVGLGLKITSPTPTPISGDVLKWNGSQWVSGANTPVVGGASVFYLDPISTLADNLTLQPSPSLSPEIINAKAVSASLGVVFFERFVSAPLGRSSIPAGTWHFDNYVSNNNSTGLNKVHVRINKRVAKLGMTGTFTGSGATRTFTVTGGTPFVAGDANASRLLAGLIETPTQTAWISGFTSSTVVTVTLTDVGFVNVSGVNLNAIYYLLFSVETPNITSTTPALYDIHSVQPAFTVGDTDRIVAAYFATTDGTPSRTMSLYYGGNTNYTHIETPISTLHNDLAGLNDGDYKHLTAAQQSALHAYQTSIVGITGTKAQFDTAVTDGNIMYVGDAPTAHNQAWNTITSTPTTISGYGITDAYHTGNANLSTVNWAANNVTASGDYAFSGAITHFIQNRDISDISIKIWNGTIDLIPITFKPTGNVGIGYSTGTEITNNKLAVNGSVFVNGNSVINAGVGSWAEGLNIESSNGIWGGVKFRTVGRTGNQGNWHFGYDTTHTGITGGNNIHLYTSAIAGYVMTFLESGNVGIGYSTGTEITNNKLAVNGSVFVNGQVLSINSDTITTTVSITNATLTAGGYSQDGKTILIANGVNVINYTINGAITASFVKGGTGAITFVQGAGRTLVNVYGLVFSGAVGSTASIASFGTTDYLYINNV